MSCRASLCHGTAPADAYRLLPARTAGQSLPKGASQRGNLPRLIFPQNQDRIRIFSYFTQLYLQPWRHARKSPAAHSRKLKAFSALCLGTLQAPLQLLQSLRSLNKVVFESSADSLNSRREAQPVWELPRHAQHLSPTAPRRNDSPESSKARLGLAVCCSINAGLRGDAPSSPT